MPDVVYRGTQADLVHLLTVDLPKLVEEGHGELASAVMGFYYRIANTVLSIVQRNFIVKSRGGTGTDGIKWKPLKPETIARRKATREELKALGVTGRRVRGFLTPEQDRRWRQVYAGVLHRMKFDGQAEASSKAKAAAIAWATVKREGAKTKLKLLGGRIVDILRDEGLLLRSFTPGVETTTSGEDGQIVRLIPRGVLVGSNQKPWHHHGIEGRLPARPFWPEDGSIPPAWWPEITAAAGRGLLKLVEEVVRIQSGRKAA